MATLTKGQLELQLAQERARREKAEQLLDEAEDTISQYENGDTADTPALKADSDDTLPTAKTTYGEPRMVKDPFSRQNPHKIIAHPAGFRLSWKNPKFRGTRGWQGWVKIQWDDEIGQNLDRYILDAPSRMEHDIDNYVRRGDAMLCRLPIEWWDSRQSERSHIANRFAEAHAADMERDDPRTVAKQERGKHIAGRTMSS